MQLIRHLRISTKVTLVALINVAVVGLIVL